MFYRRCYIVGGFDRGYLIRRVFGVGRGSSCDWEWFVW